MLLDPSSYSRQNNDKFSDDDVKQQLFKGGSKLLETFSTAASSSSMPYVYAFSVKSK